VHRHENPATLAESGDVLSNSVAGIKPTLSCQSAHYSVRNFKCPSERLPHISSRGKSNSRVNKQTSPRRSLNTDNVRKGKSDSDAASHWRLMELLRGITRSLSFGLKIAESLEIQPWLERFPDCRIRRTFNFGTRPRPPLARRRRAIEPFLRFRFLTLRFSVFLILCLHLTSLPTISNNHLRGRKCMHGTNIASFRTDG
jgi:hypothetical protein